MFQYAGVKKYRCRFVGKTVVVYENTLQDAKKSACVKAEKTECEIVEIYRA